MVSAVFKVAGYTYGPLLGLFSFGLFSTRIVKDKIVPIICVLSVGVTYLLNINSESLLNGFKFGFEILLVNGLLTYTGLMIFSSKKSKNSI